LKGAYDAKNTLIVNNSKEKHVCNDERNYVITKGYNCDNVNQTYLLDRLWPYLLHLIGVTNVKSVVKKMILVC